MISQFLDLLLIAFIGQLLALLANEWPNWWLTYGLFMDWMDLLTYVWLINIISFGESMASSVHSWHSIRRSAYGSWLMAQGSWLVFWTTGLARPSRNVMLFWQRNAGTGKVFTQTRLGDHYPFGHEQVSEPNTYGPYPKEGVLLTLK